MKNKVAPPFRKVELDIYFGKGVSAVASLLDSAVKHGFIDKRGAWYTRGDEKVGQGKDNAIKFLTENADYAKQLEAQIRSDLFPGQILRTREGVAVYPEQEKAVLEAKKAKEKAEKEAKKAAEKEAAAKAPKLDIGAETASPNASDALF